MLRITIHAGAPKDASRFNLVSSLDIAYKKLAPIADYKVVLFEAGLGATEQRTITGYPRWSASLWDLVARGLALTLHPDAHDPKEEVVPAPPVARCAFARELCVFIHHFSGSGTARTELGTAVIQQAGRTRGHYKARFEEHAGPIRRVESFQFAPDYLRPGELLLRAILASLDTLCLPPRPALCVPAPVEREGRRYVPIHRLVEPARTGFQLWLHKNSEVPSPESGAPLGLAPENIYVQFLGQAI